MRGPNDAEAAAQTGTRTMIRPVRHLRHPIPSHVALPLDGDVEPVNAGMHRDSIVVNAATTLYGVPIAPEMNSDLTRVSRENDSVGDNVTLWLLENPLYVNANPRLDEPLFFTMMSCDTLGKSCRVMPLAYDPVTQGRPGVWYAGT